ncbi:M48 family metallopeptidase [Mesorhizobium sp.]|uniref:M48 family metallopeptidase n=1 Tax=Mesorhizobium sp. TaxID=1871066 RepID=UPI000FE71730|nr:SprT family zinc-dependent metalloprotease [Mesorhizobium sp.]RWA80467.1 MAG: M48 family peptidase [Mesorhizobium sp.]
MPTLQIGRKQIPYELRRSAAASERRITVTPGHVEVLALTSDDEHDIAGFLERKRQWVFNTVREMERITSDRHAVPRFMSGSKILFRGRRMRLAVRRTDGDRIELSFRNGFIVDLPTWAGSDADKLVARELRLWLRGRVRRDVTEVAADYKTRFGLSPRSIRVADFANSWGSCGAEGNILINWHLVFAPRKVLEYVVAHELCHLRHRSHGPAFWSYLASILPGFERPKAWLEANGGSLTADFLNPSGL